MKRHTFYRITCKTMDWLTPVWFQDYCAYLARKAGHPIDSDQISILF